MWRRRTFHECASELEIVSQYFRNAYLRKSKLDQQSRDELLRETSERGIEILRILALSIRSEDDYGAIHWIVLFPVLGFQFLESIAP